MLYQSCCTAQHTFQKQYYAAHLAVTHQQCWPAARWCSLSVEPWRQPHPHTPLIPPALPAAAAAATAAATAAALTQLQDLKCAFGMRNGMAGFNLA
jgi:hypothetical protein